ncbi:MAG: hypothetical protein P1R58_10400 [bacterium]|nr:hypothetical protein [bacterium]
MKIGKVWIAGRNRKASLPIDKRGIDFLFSRIGSILAEAIHKLSQARFVAISIAGVNQMRSGRPIKEPGYFNQLFLGDFLVGFTSELSDRLAEYRARSAIANALYVRGFYSLGARFMIWQSTVLSILSFKNRRVI